MLARHSASRGNSGASRANTSERAGPAASSCAMRSSFYRNSAG